MEEGIYIISPHSCVVRAHSIADAWFQVMRAAFGHGKDYTITRGSFVGRQRRELDVELFIVAPEVRPFTPFVPKGMQAPVTDDGAIHEYFESYWLSPGKAKGEDYAYGDRIHPQLFPLIEMLKRTPYTNQACIEVARPEDIHLDSPPCLRLIDLRLWDGVLSARAYLRSWDVWAALPYNLGALQLLVEFIAGEVGCRTGSLRVGSKGAHLYDRYWEMAEQYVGHLVGSGWRD